MAFDALAYAADEPWLITIDGAELLAHDADTEAPRWRLAFERPLVAVVLVDPQTLPSAQGGSPWRSQSLTHVAIALDDAGHLHVVDASLGTLAGTLGPFGAPRAFAMSRASASVALAVNDVVHVWRLGERRELAIRASALAFSCDGASLAVGTERGELVTFDGAGETGRTKLDSAVVDLAAHPGGTWAVATPDGVFAPPGNRLNKIDPRPRRIRFDASGTRLAVQRNEWTIVVCDWPSLSVAARIEYTARPVHGLAFGPGNWLGVALDHGDGNKIDVVTTKTHRTDTHPGREHRSWSLLVEGRPERMEGEVTPSPHPSPKASPFTGRIGIGAMISIALLGVRVCVHASKPSPSYDSMPRPIYVPPTLAPSPAESGNLRLAGLFGMHRPDHAELVRLTGPELTPTIEAVPERNPLDGESPRAVWAAEDGSVFVVTSPGDRREITLVHERTPTGAWLAPSELTGRPNGEIFGASNAELYVGTSDALWHRVGTHWSHAKTVVRTAALSGNDLVIVDSANERIERRKGQAWVPETIPQHLAVRTLFGGRGVWAVAENDDYDDVLLQRTAAGTWAKRPLPNGAKTLNTVWVSPTGDAFVSADEGVFRFANGTWTERPAPLPVGHMWGRSSSDVYGGSVTGLAHYDGKTWSKTSYAGRVDALAGTANEVFVLRTKGPVRE